MASPAPAPEPVPATNGTSDAELDIAKLHALPTEQQDLFLLTFVSDLQHHVEQLSAEALPAHQASIKKEVIKIVGLGAPTPSRVVRNTLGRILGDAFGRGSRSLLYETINDLVSILNAGKNDKEVGARHAAAVCLGALYRSAGDSAISLSGLVVASLLKLLNARPDPAAASS